MEGNMRGGTETGLADVRACVRTRTFELMRTEKSGISRTMAGTEGKARWGGRGLVSVRMAGRGDG